MVDEVFLEVPFYVAGYLRVLLVRQELVERMHVGALDGDLGKEGEGCLLVLPAEVLDLQVGAGLLPVEIIGGERQDLETLGLVFFLE